MKQNKVHIRKLGSVLFTVIAISAFGSFVESASAEASLQTPAIPPCNCSFPSTQEAPGPLGCTLRRICFLPVNGGFMDCEAGTVKETDPATGITTSFLADGKWSPWEEVCDEE